MSQFLVPSLVWLFLPWVLEFCFRIAPFALLVYLQLRMVTYSIWYMATCPFGTSHPLDSSCCSFHF